MKNFLKFWTTKNLVCLSSGIWKTFSNFNSNSVVLPEIVVRIAQTFSSYATMHGATFLNSHSISLEVQLFWEGRKNLKKSPIMLRNFKRVGDFFEFCGLHNIWNFPSYDFQKILSELSKFHRWKIKKIFCEFVERKNKIKCNFRNSPTQLC